MAPTSRTAPPPDDFTENIVDIDIDDEMRDELPRVRLLGDLHPGAARRPRRSEAGAAPAALHDVGDGASARPPLREVLARRRRDHGQVPPARRHRPVRRPGADGPGLGDAAADWSTVTATSARPTTRRRTMRYTECRLDAPALAMTDSLDEDVVDFRPNYDGRDTEPTVLPAAFPNLLVNGGQRDRGRHGHQHGAAQPRRGDLGGAPPARPARTRRLDEIMRFVPGPDLPTGGKHRRPRRHPRRLRRRPRLVPDPGDHPHRGDHAAPAGHRGHRTARTTSGPERLRKSIRDLVEAKRLLGIAVARGPLRHGERPAHRHRRQERLQPRSAARAAVPADADGGQLLASTTSRSSTGSRARSALLDLLRIYLDDRSTSSAAAPTFRHRKAQAELHLRRGPADRRPRHRRGHPGDPDLRRRRRAPAIGCSRRLRPDPVAGRPHPRVAAAPADPVLPARTRTSARRAGRHDRATSTRSSRDEEPLRSLVSDELAESPQAFGTPRRTVLLESAGVPATTATPLEVADDPARCCCARPACWRASRSRRPPTVLRPALRAGGGPGMTSSSRPSGRPTGRRSVSSRRGAGSSGCLFSTCPRSRRPPGARHCRAACRSGTCSRWRPASGRSR